MALEDVMERLIVALNASTAARGGAAPAPGKTAPTGTKAAAKITIEQVRAALTKVMDLHGKSAAKKIINEEGSAKEVNAIKPTLYPAVLAACEEILSAQSDPEEEEEGEL